MVNIKAVQLLKKQLMEAGVQSQVLIPVGEESDRYFRTTINVKLLPKPEIGFSIELPPASSKDSALNQASVFANQFAGI